MFCTNYEQSRNLCEQLEMYSIPYELAVTSGTVTVILRSGRKIMFADSKLAFPFLVTFLRKRASEFTNYKRYSWEKEKYVAINTTINDRDTIVFEVDIKRAYWTAAKNIGLISEEEHKKYLSTIFKGSTNAAIGALEMEKRYYSVDEAGVKTEDEDAKKVIAFGRVRKEIVMEIWGIYEEISRNTNVLLFWVDAFFVKSEDDVAKIYEILTARGYGYKEAIPYFMRVFPGRIEISSSDPEKKPRFFSYGKPRD